MAIWTELRLFKIIYIYFFSVICEFGMCGINCTEDCTQESSTDHVERVCKDECEDDNLNQIKDSKYIYVLCKNGCIWKTLTRITKIRIDTNGLS